MRLFTVYASDVLVKILLPREAFVFALAVGIVAHELRFGPAMLAVHFSLMP